MKLKEMMPWTKEFEEMNKRNVKNDILEDVQPKVWNGKIYIAYLGKPLVSIDMLNVGIVDAVENIQKTLTDYILREK